MPRDDALHYLPGMTTNVEFGFIAAAKHKRTLIGAPPGTKKMSYLYEVAKIPGGIAHHMNPTLPYQPNPIPTFTDLRKILTAAVKLAQS